MDERKMIEWIAGRRVGISSKTMWAALMDVKPNTDDRPYDMADFSLCYDLFKYAELTKGDLNKIAMKYPYFAPLVDRWSDLCTAYEQRNVTVFKEIMSTIYGK